MTFDMKRVVIELEYRGIIPVEKAMGTRIDCLRGCIWITESGSTEDIVLEAGQSHELWRNGVAVVQGLRNALIALHATAVPKAGAEIAASVERLGSPLAARSTGARPAVAQLGSA